MNRETRRLPHGREFVYREEEGRRASSKAAWSLRRVGEIDSCVEGHFSNGSCRGRSGEDALPSGPPGCASCSSTACDFLDGQPIAKLEEVREEDDGAYYRASLFPSLPDLVMDGLRHGLYGSSYRHASRSRATVNRRPEQVRPQPRGLEERSVTEALLHEISVVTFPAYGAPPPASARSPTSFSPPALLQHPERSATTRARTDRG